MESSWRQHGSCVVSADGTVRLDVPLDAWAWRVAGGERMRTPDEEEAIARVKAGMAPKPAGPMTVKPEWQRPLCAWHTLSKGEPRCAAGGRHKVGSVRLCARHFKQIKGEEAA